MFFDIFRALIKLKDGDAVFAFLSFFSCFQAGMYIWKHSDVKPFLKQVKAQVVHIVRLDQALSEGGKFLSWNHDAGWAGQTDEVLNFSKAVVSGFIGKQTSERRIDGSFFGVIQAAL